MLTKVLDGVLPGLRDLREPIASGLLWTIFGWLVLQDRIPSGSEATGFAGQVYDLADALGRGASIAVVVILLFMLGVTLRPVSDALRWPAALVWKRGSSWLSWQGAARSRRRLLEATKSDREAKLAEAVGKGQTNERAEKEVRDLDVLSSHRRPLGLLTRRTEATMDAFDRAPADWEFAQLILDAVAREGVAAEAAKSGSLLGTEDIYPMVHVSPRELLAINALDVARAHDDAFFQTLDRQQSERELRCGTMIPIAAIAGHVAVEVHPVAWVFVALALLVFARNSQLDADETSRVLHYLAEKRAPLLAYDEAREAGRNAFRSALRESQQPGREH